MSQSTKYCCFPKQRQHPRELFAESHSTDHPAFILLLIVPSLFERKKSKLLVRVKRSPLLILTNLHFSESV